MWQVVDRVFKHDGIFVIIYFCVYMFITYMYILLWLVMVIDVSLGKLPLELLPQLSIG